MYIFFLCPGSINEKIKGMTKRKKKMLVQKLSWATAQLYCNIIVCIVT